MSTVCFHMEQALYVSTGYCQYPHSYVYTCVIVCIASSTVYIRVLLSISQCQLSFLLATVFNNVSTFFNFIDLILSLSACYVSLSVSPYQLLVSTWYMYCMYSRVNCLFNFIDLLLSVSACYVSLSVSPYQLSASTWYMHSTYSRVTVCIHVSMFVCRRAIVWPCKLSISACQLFFSIRVTVCIHVSTVFNFIDLLLSLSAWYSQYLLVTVCITVSTVRFHMIHTCTVCIHVLLSYVSTCYCQYPHSYVCMYTCYCLYVNCLYPCATVYICVLLSIPLYHRL